MPESLARLEAALADRYRVEGELGSGGMATVYLAEDLKHHRQVAIKVLHPDLATSLGAERFVREIKIAAQLSHPHILPLFDSGAAAEFLYYVMPYVEGESLRQRLKREGKFPIQEVIRLTDEIAAALSYAHEHGIVHRDVKPENILLTGGRAVVADFGIARAVTVAGGGHLTGTGIVVGTPAYMSPEQAFSDAEIDGRSDIYALGCVVYEMATGRAPFRGGTPQQVLARHAMAAPPSLRAVDPKIPLFLERAVDRALAKNPHERFQSARAFADALTSEFVVARVGGWRWLWQAVALSLLASTVLAVAWGVSTFGGGHKYKRLAVLPPTNLLHAPEDEYIAQGMHDALISQLKRAGVTVIARTSVLRYSQTQKSIKEIAGELGVDAVVESSIYRAGDSVAMEVRLVSGRTEEFLADPITGAAEVGHLSGLSRDLTHAVAVRIHEVLSPQTEARLASPRPVDPESYDAYLKGSFHWVTLTPQDLDIAEHYFRLALERDSLYAPAWEGLSRVWAGRQQIGIVAPQVAGPSAKAAALRAIALDDTHSGAHEVLAMVRTWTDWDWDGAEVEWRRAVELDPDNPTAQAYFALFLATTGHAEEALSHSRRAVEADPFNPTIHGLYAQVLCSAGRYDEAIAEAQSALAMQPDATGLVVPGALECAYVSKGMLDEHLALQRRRLARDTERIAVMDAGFTEGGYLGAMRRVADLLAERYHKSGGAPDRSARPIIIATWYLFADEYDRSIGWLERSFEVRDPGLPNIALRPYWRRLRADPRFRALLREMNLDQR